jgi:hypothetical protein
MEHLCQLADTKPDDKSIKDFVRDKTDESFRKLLKSLADDDPNKASKLSRFFEAMKKGDFR